MSSDKGFDLPPKCPGLLSTKLTGFFGWRHTYRVHHRQKGINLYSQHNLKKSYSLTITPKKHHITSSNPSLPEASSTNPDSWVVVHHLQSQSGILDPDDHVHDVTDDREQILASYDDHPGPELSVPQGGGDGASGSSVGTGSPDIFHVQDGMYTNYNETIPTHIDVGEKDQPPNGLTLQVRRGSEPSLLTLDQNTQLYSRSNSQEPTKRWSAAPVCRDDPPEPLLAGNANKYLSPKWVVPEEENHGESLPSFSRSGRLSMQFLGDGANYRWIEAAEKAVINDNPSINNSTYFSKSLPRDAKRKEPLGQANSSTYESIRQKNGEMLLVTNETGGILGLSAIPDQENGGLLVQSVEPDSRAEKGRLRRGDRILEINGINLMELSEVSVQEQLRKCIMSSELRLRVIRARSESKRNRVEMLEAEKKSDADSKVAHVSPTRKVPGTTKALLQAANTRKLGKRIDLSLKKGAQGLGFSVTTRDNPAGGYCPIYIKNILPKGAAIEDGRLKPGDRLLEVDNVTMTGKSQSEVVNILRATQPGSTVMIVVSRQQKSSSIDEREIGDDTQLKQPPPPVLPKNVMKSPSDSSILDRLGKTEGNDERHEDIVKMRLNKFGTSNSTELNGNIFPWRYREILTLYIPVHDTEKAGLGVSVKGKTGQMTPNSSLSRTTLNNTNKHDGDLGIFIKSVLHGGAASRDGRLKMNDQLLSVNGISLLGQSNADAMDTLRRAMLQTGGRNPGIIILKIARRAPSRPSSTINECEHTVVDSSGTNSSDQSGSTVIYVSPATSTDINSNLNRKSQSPTTLQETERIWSNPVIDRLTGRSATGIRPSTLMQVIPGGLRNDSYYMATNDTWSPMVNLNGSKTVLIEEDLEPISPISLHSIRPDLHHQISTSTPTSRDITYDSQLSLENSTVDTFSRDAVGRRSMSEKHHAAMDARETGTYQRNKKMREDREKCHVHSSVESLTNVSSNRIGSMKTNRQRSELRSEALDHVGELGPSLGMKKSSSLESLQTMVQEIQMSDELRGPNALRAPRGRGREEILRAAVEHPEARKHWLVEDGGDNDGGFSNRGTLKSSSKEVAKNKDRIQKKPGLLKGIGSMFRFGKHRKDVFPTLQTEVITDYTSWSNDTSSKSDTLGQASSSSVVNNREKTARHQREICNERQHTGSNGPPSYHPPPRTVTTTVPNCSKITQNDAFNHRYSHYVNYDELQTQIRNKLIVTKQQNQPNHQQYLEINIQPTLIVADDLETKAFTHQQQKHLQSCDRSEKECLSDSTIEKMRLQVQLQREKVKDESRKNHHYHSQRSARSNVDMGHYHQYNAASSIIVNGHKYHPQQAQLQAQYSMHQHPTTPISSFYEYETINPNENYRKIGDHFNPLQNSSSKIFNGSSSVRVSGNTLRRPIPDLKPHQHPGPFITQVHIRDQNGKQPSASKV